ncbi:MAG: Glycosyl transferase family 2, partial [Candidatus Woesebacteria bacterium GW2011_GWA2_40_7b]
MTILKTISIVIPVYNEEKFIKKTIEEVIKADSLGLKKEIVVVDDGSTDSTTLILKKIKNKSVKNNLVLILKKKNEGKGAALKDGFKNTSGDIVL